jgi:threonine dehydrogenase-like Zn-dependent dehydrogenase
MRATVMYGAGDVRVEEVPGAQLMESTDVVVRVTRAAICGSDLWPYKSMEPTANGRRMGHELIGVVEDVGADVQKFKVGELVVSPFLISDGTCAFCRRGLHSSCTNGAGLASAESMEPRGKQFACRMQTARSSRCPMTRATSCCLRFSPWRT